MLGSCSFCARVKGIAQAITDEINGEYRKQDHHTN